MEISSQSDGDPDDHQIIAVLLHAPSDDGSSDDSSPLANLTSKRREGGPAPTDAYAPIASVLGSYLRNMMLILKQMSSMATRRALSKTLLLLLLRLDVSETAFACCCGGALSNGDAEL